MDEQIQLLTDLSGLLRSKKPRRTSYFSKRNKESRVNDADERERRRSMIRDMSKERGSFVCRPLSPLAIKNALEERGSFVIGKYASSSRRVSSSCFDFIEIDQETVNMAHDPFEAIQDGDIIGLKKWILTKGENSGTVNFMNRFNGRTLLHEASITGQEPIVRMLLRYYYIKINKQTFLGKNTPLHLAAEGGHNHIVRVLVHAGADVNIRNKLGEQPIHLASDPHVALTLLRNGANLFSKTKVGLTPSQCAATKGYNAVYDLFTEQITLHHRRRLELQEEIARRRRAHEMAIEQQQLKNNFEQFMVRQRSEYEKWRG